MAFKQWSDQVFSNIGEFLFGSPSEEALAAADAMNKYFLQEIAALRVTPRDHLLGRLVATETDEGFLSDAELLSFCRLLLIAGNETTTGLISASAKIFHEYPETLEQIAQQPELSATFVEEALRFYSPFAATVRRAVADTQIGGKPVTKGQLILPLIASANRDERVFDEPERFIIDRKSNPHLALGYGIHFCLGAHLARLEGRIAAELLAKNFAKITLAEPETAIMGGLGGPKTLPVILTAK